MPYEYFNGQGCMCLDGYSRINGLCQPTGNNNGTNGTNITCPSNSYLSGKECICNSGYTKANGVCVPNSNPGCGANSYDNGLGFCVCNSGYYKVNGTCVAGSQCPPSSTRNTQG